MIEEGSVEGPMMPDEGEEDGSDFTPQCTLAAQLVGGPKHLPLHDVARRSKGG